MNYTYQSFNFRNRQGARPFYDLVASIADEEIAQKLREAAGLPKEPTGEVAN